MIFRIKKGLQNTVGDHHLPELLHRRDHADQMPGGGCQNSILLVIPHVGYLHHQKAVGRRLERNTSETSLQKGASMVMGKNGRNGLNGQLTLSYSALESQFANQQQVFNTFNLTSKFHVRSFFGEAGISILNVFNRDNLLYNNLKRVPASQTSNITLYQRSVSFTPILYLKAGF